MSKHQTRSGRHVVADLSTALLAVYAWWARTGRRPEGPEVAEVASEGGCKIFDVICALGAIKKIDNAAKGQAPDPGGLHVPGAGLAALSHGAMRPGLGKLYPTARVRPNAGCWPTVDHNAAFPLCRGCATNQW